MWKVVLRVKKYLTRCPLRSNSRFFICLYEVRFLCELRRYSVIILDALIFCVWVCVRVCACL